MKTSHLALLALLLAGTAGSAGAAGPDHRNHPGATHLGAARAFNMADLTTTLADASEKAGPNATLATLQDLCVKALDSGAVLAFRDVMARTLDGNWSGLDRGDTALAMISWMPDTGRFLVPRINAAIIATQTERLDAAQSRRLWKELRARAERTGEPRVLLDLVRGMVLSGMPYLAIDSISRFHPARRARTAALAELITSLQGKVARSDLHPLIDALDRMETAHPSDRGPGARNHEITRAYWISGYRQRALERLRQDPDPVDRFRIGAGLMSLPAPDPGPGSGK